MAVGYRYELPYDGKLNDMIQTLFSGHMTYVKSAVDYTASLADIVIEIIADKKVVVPQAAASNKGKFYIVNFTAAATSAGGIEDDQESAKVIIPKALCLDNSVFLLISDGSAWKEIVLNAGA